MLWGFHKQYTPERHADKLDAISYGNIQKVTHVHEGKGAPMVSSIDYT